MPLAPGAMDRRADGGAGRRPMGRNALICGALGLAITVGLAWLSAIAVDPTQKAPISAAGQVGGAPWSVSLYRGWGAAYVHAQWQRGLNWSPAQATGAPDTPVSGDKVTAWASASADGAPEWLVLEYGKAVVPARIEVHENHCPGALVKVTVFNDAGEEVQAWAGKDPTPVGAATGSGISKIALSGEIKTSRIKLYIDSPSVQGWNEIDAVALIDRDGGSQWAASATASSWYGSGGTALVNGPPPVGLAPGWSGMQEPPGELFGTMAVVERGAEARGWPMLALWTPRDPGALGGAATGTGAPMQSAKLVGVSPGRSRRWVPAGGPGTPGGLPPTLPWRPIWGGLLINTALYGALVAGGWWVVTRPKALLIEVHRMRRGCCLQCGYDLGFDFQHGCAWCGWRRSEDVARAPGERGVGEGEETREVGRR